MDERETAGISVVTLCRSILSLTISFIINHVLSVFERKHLGFGKGEDGPDEFRDEMGAFLAEYLWRFAEGSQLKGERLFRRWIE